jgi:hypothetical protein
MRLSQDALAFARKLAASRYRHLPGRVTGIPAESGQTLSFVVDGATYEVELSDKNRAKLEKALSPPFIEHGRRATRPRRRSSTAGRTLCSAESTAIRTWARERGLRVSERGRISAELIY